jgi:hypothetical protein
MGFRQSTQKPVFRAEAAAATGLDKQDTVVLITVKR